MRNKFIFLAAVLTAVVFMTGCTSGKNMKDDVMHNDIMDDDIMMSNFVLESGTIMAGDGMSSELLIKSDAMAEESDVILINQEATPAIDAVSGASIKKAGIKKGVKIHAWVSSAYTASMPPKTAARVILLNAKDKSEIPVLIEVAGLSSAKDGMTITANDGSMWMFEKNAMIEMHSAVAGKKVNASALKKGAMILLWKDGMMINKDKMMGDKMMMKGPHKVKKILIIEK